MNSISDYLTVTTPLPRYLPYARFLLDTDLSHTAKLLYTLLLDRATLSQKNNWIDAQGRIYVLYPLSSLAKDLGCSISSITRSFTELENAQLVERIRSGFSKPSRILLKVPHTTQNCTVIVSKNAEHDCAEMRCSFDLWRISQCLSDGKRVQATQSRFLRAGQPDRTAFSLYPVHWKKVC